MKYPSCILAGEGATGLCISIGVGSKGQFQDTGSKMIHAAPNTRSSIISKSVSRNGGVTNFRDEVHFTPAARNSKAHIECDTLILDNISKSDTIPTNSNMNNSSTIEHEAKVSKISEDVTWFKRRTSNRNDCHGIPRAVYKRITDGIRSRIKPVNETGYEWIRWIKTLHVRKDYKHVLSCL